MIRVNFNAARLGLLAGAALLLAASSSYALSARHDAAGAPAPVSTGTCTSGASAYSVSTDLQTTTARKYKDVTGTSVAFTQGASGCVEVSFSGEGATTPGELMETQAVIDGTTVCLPGNNLFASDSPSSDLADHAMNYICTGVSAGNHTAKIQFRSRFGGKVALDYRATIVRYAP